MNSRIIIFLFLLNLGVMAQQSPELAFSKSYAFEYNSDYNKAILALGELSNDNYQVNLRLGWLYYLNKDYVKSEIHYKKAVAVEPASLEARFGLVLPLSAIGNWNNVLNIYIEILKIDPNNTIANYRTANIYFNRKDYTNASNYIVRVIKLYPFDFDSNLLNGKILMAQGKNAEARKFLSKAIEYNPHSEEAAQILKKLQ